MSRIDNRDDVINIRNVFDRIEELEDEYRDEDTGEVVGASAVWDDSDRAEYDSLCALVSQCDGVSGDPSQVREHLILVRESYWQDYVRQWYDNTHGRPWIHSDRYGSPRFDKTAGQYARVSWDDIVNTKPFGFIDWTAAADDMRREAPEVEWEGVIYIFG